MPTLWTIGYEGRAQHDVIALLVQSDIELLVDVRLRPQSRKPGLSRKGLAAELPHAGIEYLHRRELGTPLEIRGLYRAGEFERASREYRTHLLAHARESLEWLAETAAQQPTAILCFELAPTHCHRRVVSEELRRQYDYTVVDL